MSKKIILSFALAIAVFTSSGFYSPVHAQSVTASRAELLAMIEQLLSLIATLKAQTAAKTFVPGSCVGEDKKVYNQGDIVMMPFKSATPSPTLISERYYECKRGQWSFTGKEDTYEVATVSFLPSSAKQRTDEVGQVYGSFEINFNLSVDGDDVYINESDIRSRVTVDGPELKFPVRTTVVTKARKSKGFYVVKDGDTAAFTIKVEVFPQTSGKYSVGVTDLPYLRGATVGVLESPRYTNERNKQTKSLTLTVEPVSGGFVTSPTVWAIPKRNADILVVGVYEGTYPDGTARTRTTNQEGEVEVYIDSTNSENTLLILNAYHSVHWKLTGPQANNVKGIVMTGYYDQRVSGLPNQATVVEQTYSNGASSDEYFIVYNGRGTEDDEFPELVDYVKQKTNLAPYLFFGGYQESSIIVGVKG